MVFGGGSVVFRVFGLTAVLDISNKSRVTIPDGVGNGLGTAVREEHVVSEKVNKQLTSANCKQTADFAKLTVR